MFSGRRTEEITEYCFARKSSRGRRPGRIGFFSEPSFSQWRLLWRLRSQFWFGWYALTHYERDREAGFLPTAPSSLVSSQATPSHRDVQRSRGTSSSLAELKRNTRTVDASQCRFQSETAPLLSKGR